MVKYDIRRSDLILLMRQAVESKKRKNPCPCGEYDPLVLDMHHIDPRTKGFSISAVIRHPPPGMTLEGFLDELNKCVPICANCHRRLHAIEANTASAEDFNFLANGDEARANLALLADFIFWNKPLSHANKKRIEENLKATCPDPDAQRLYGWGARMLRPPRLCRIAGNKISAKENKHEAVNGRSVVSRTRVPESNQSW